MCLCAKQLSENHCIARVGLRLKAQNFKLHFPEDIRKRFVALPRGIVLWWWFLKRNKAKSLLTHMLKKKTNYINKIIPSTWLAMVATPSFWPRFEGFFLFLFCLGKQMWHESYTVTFLLYCISNTAKLGLLPPSSRELHILKGVGIPTTGWKEKNIPEFLIWFRIWTYFSEITNSI